MTGGPGGAVAQRPSAGEPVSHASGSTFRPWAIAAAWVGVATALQLLRQSGVPSVDTIWAEDGQLFLADAIREGLGAVLDPAGGYLHLAPRLLALMAAALPIGWAAWVFAAGSAVLVSLLSAYVFVASRPALPSAWARGALAGAIVLLPAAAFESVANAANLQYYFLFASLCALAHRPTTRGGVAAASSVVIMATMSTTLAALFAPLAVWRAVRGGRDRGRVVGIVFLAGMAVQAVTVFRALVLDADPTLAQYPVRWSGSDVTDLPGLYGLRVGAALLVGDRWVDDAWGVVGWWLAVLGLALPALAIGVALLRRGSTRTWAMLAAGLSVLTFVLPVAARGTGHLLPTAGYSYAGNRFTLVPMWLLVAAGLVVAERTGRAPRAFLVAILLALAVANFRAFTPRSAGPSWSGEVAIAKPRCSVPGVMETELHIAPAFRTPSAWRVRIPCGRLT